MQIHLITGTKGGVGKTLCTLCAIQYFKDSKGQFQIVVFDANTANQNTSNILSLAPGSKIRNIGNDLVQWNFDQNIVVCRAKEPYEIREIVEFWDRVLEIVKFWSNQNNNTVLIIDTSFRPGNLVGQSKISDIEAKIREIANCQIDQLYIWCIWSIEAIIARYATEDTVEEISETIEILQPQKIVAPWQAKVVHVFNLHTPPESVPSAHSVMDKLIKKVFGKIKSGIAIGEESYKRLSLSEYAARPLDFQEMRNVFDATSGRIVRNELHPNEVLEILADCIIKKVKEDLGSKDNRIRPKNIFPIPVYVDSLVNYTATMALSGEIHDFAQIANIIQEISEPLKVYISKL